MTFFIRSTESAVVNHNASLASRVVVPYEDLSLPDDKSFVLIAVGAYDASPAVDHDVVRVGRPGARLAVRRSTGGTVVGEYDTGVDDPDSTPSSSDRSGQMIAHLAVVDRVEDLVRYIQIDSTGGIVERAVEDSYPDTASLVDDLVAMEGMSGIMTMLVFDVFSGAWADVEAAWVTAITGVLGEATLLTKGYADSLYLKLILELQQRVDALEAI